MQHIKVSPLKYFSDAAFADGTFQEVFFFFFKCYLLAMKKNKMVKSTFFNHFTPESVDKATKAQEPVVKYYLLETLE